jgi:hypothetical protein
LLKRLVLGVRAAFGGLLRLGAIMMPPGGFRLFLCGFKVGIVGQQFRMALGVAEGLGKCLSFKGNTPLPWGGFGLFL